MVVVVSSVDPNFSRSLVVYRCENAAGKFVRDLQQEAKQFDEYIATPKRMMLTATELRSFNNATTFQFGLIRRKGVYPYDNMDSFDRFDETKLPSHDAFSSKLSGRPCSDSEYKHASTCSWMCFSKQTTVSTRYIITPLLIWLGLQLSECHGVDLLLITDVDMYHFVENSIRGGISMIFTRHAQVNSLSLRDTYDSSLPNQNLIYLDANNLYGSAMSQSVPTHGFRFLQQDKISTLKLQELPDDTEDGYIFEVDLHYLTHIHDRHDDYPLTPSH